MIRLIPSRLERALGSTGRMRTPLRFLALYRYYRFIGKPIHQAALLAFQLRAK